jgi:hypothetical protein
LLCESRKKYGWSRISNSLFNTGPNVFGRHFLKLAQLFLNDLINNPNVQKVAARQQEREALLKDISVTSNI